MTRRNSLHYCYDVSYQCWFTSEEAKIYCYNFNSSNAVLSNSCVLCTTRCNKCGRIGTKWLFFFTFIEECCVVIEKNIDKKLAIRISYRIWYKRCSKGKFCGGEGGVKICEGGSISVSRFGRGGRVAVCNVDLFSGQVTPFIALIQLSFIQWSGKYIYHTTLAIS